MKLSNLNMRVEYNPLALQAGEFVPAEFLDLLDNLGFDVHCILADGSLGRIPEDIEGNVNLLCSRL